MPAKTEKVDKVIVTNLTALKAKYGTAGVNAIKAALQNLIAADKKRGLATRLVTVDTASVMKKLHTLPVKNATDPRQNKKAIDDIYKALVPDYLLIVGSIDVIPHQDLKNPLYSPPDEPDRFAFGDLPYACEAPYSQNPQDFFGPTRVVGRLPDLTGGKDPKYLIDLLNTAAVYQNIDLAKYNEYFGVTAQIWKGSTALSLKNMFGGSSKLKSVPTSKSSWPASLLKKQAHFFNCHGASNSSQFFGQPASGAQDYPVALDAEFINKKISEGTVAAAECCYGAQLYKPSLNGDQPGICSTYLANKAYGFFGSTTIAYGPSEGNDQADLICQFFLQSLLQGASLGRAALEARQRFLHSASMSDPANIKTLAQFNLYSDPSLSPIKLPHAITPTRTKGTAEESSAIALRVERSERRRDLFSRGLALAESQPKIRKVSKKPTRSVQFSMEKVARDNKMTPSSTLTFDVKQPPMAKSMPMALMAKEINPSRIHVVFGADKMGKKKSRGKTRKGKAELAKAYPPIVQIVALIVKEVNGKVVSVKKIFSR